MGLYSLLPYFDMLGLMSVRSRSNQDHRRHGAPDLLTEPVLVWIDRLFLSQRLWPWGGVERFIIFLEFPELYRYVANSWSVRRKVMTSSRLNIPMTW